MIINKVAVNLIKIYQKSISPLFPPSCRFFPSCSDYAKQAFIKYNFFKAFLISFYRIIRCNPFNKGGFDPLK